MSCCKLSLAYKSEILPTPKQMVLIYEVFGKAERRREEVNIIVTSLEHK